MRWWIFNLMLACTLCTAVSASADNDRPRHFLKSIPTTLSAASHPTNDSLTPFKKQHRPLDRRHHRQREGWERIIPTHVKWQYAGGMGYMSFGCGWDYGKKCRWETDLFIGFLPKSKSDKFYLTSTLKQNYIPWNIAITDRFSIDPFYCGLYINTIFGRQFWVRQPDRFPKKYYTFSTKLHTYIFIGQRFTVNTNLRNDSRMKGVTFFYELSTCDLYLLSSISNKYLTMKDILGFSFGIKLQLF